MIPDIRLICNVLDGIQALAALIVGASATDGKLSHLPTEIELRKCRKYARWRACNLGLASSESLMAQWGRVRPLHAQVPLGCKRVPVS